MRKTRKSLLVTLICALMFVLTLGIVTACGGSNNTVQSANTEMSVSSGKWHYGSAMPSAELGQDGDYYLNTKTLTSYKKAGQTWTVASSADSGDWLFGNGLPANEAGKANDFYLDTNTGVLYHKEGESWTVALQLFGKNGRDGVMWFSGKVAPTEVDDSIVGDFYLDYSTFDVYQLTEENGWERLGSLKGKDAATPLQFFNGNGEPSEEITAQAHEGDLYLGQFSGLEEEGALAGSKLYRYINHEWVPLMESMTPNVIHIYNYQQLVAFRESVATKDYTGTVIRLKTDIDFSKVGTEGISLFASGDATSWTPIGTKERPFKGIFDGENHTLSNFNVGGTSAGLFGATENATIRNLNIKNAAVTAAKAAEGEKSAAGILVGSASGELTVQNVNIESSSVNVPEEAKGAYAGALVGETDGSITARGVEASVDTTVTADGEETKTSSSLVGYIPYGNELDTDDSVEVKGESGKAKDLSCLQTGLHDYDPTTETCKNCGSMHPFVEGSGYLSSEGAINALPAGVTTNLAIPGIINGKPAKLAEKAFQNNATLESVTFGEGLTEIPMSAFSGCSNLTEMTLPSTLETISAYAFKSTALNEITIPASVKMVGRACFQSCSTITSVTFEEGTEPMVIDRESFMQCTNLTSVVIPANVTSIGQSAFQGCPISELVLNEGLESIGGGAFDKSTITSITIPDSVTTIGTDPFGDELVEIEFGTKLTKGSGFFFSNSQKNLKKVTIRDGATTVPDHMFDNLTNFKKVTTEAPLPKGELPEEFTAYLPDSITKIGDYVFQNCQRLTSVQLPTSLQSIGRSAFNCCYALESLVLPDSVTSIGSYAFQKCKALKWVVLPGGLNKFDKSGMFANCDVMSDIYFKGSRAEWDLKSFKADIEALGSITVHCTGDDGDLGWDGNVENLPKA